MLQFKGSSGDAAIQGSQQFQTPIPTSNRQETASFNSQVVTQTYTFSAIMDSEGDYDESAIDDDDGDWEEESAEESGSSMAEDNINFRRVDSSNNLPSRRSLITVMLSSGAHKHYL
ncbi:hypothetical protein C8A00DRAFT_38706 [Chaetomidium leptoderma]|uniref:DUF3295 domain-containing protein n=1 Tax=Chaetomidium leptoderma TaxID=669021 RepID=A0AAN6VCU6_9PEZI|nr:hypothetical protein C8A00DRAFT_38706 [Chaetomidium leptoderma]